MTTPTDTASTARRQVHLETLETIAEQVGEFELAIARMATDPAMDVGEAPELLGRAGIGSATCARCSARPDVTSSRREAEFTICRISESHRFPYA